MGRQTWRPGMSLHELADKIQNGDPVTGWDGDPRLTLARYLDPQTGDERWELWRLEHDGQYRLTARLPGHRDPSGILRELVERDARRGYDLKAAVDRHNAKVQAAADAASADRSMAAAERLVWALKKDGAI